MSTMPLYSSRYALIKDGVVINVIIADSYPTAGRIGEAHGVDEVKEVNQYAVAVGDQYVDGKFIHAGNEVERQLTLEEENARLKEQVATLQADNLMALEAVATVYEMIVEVPA